jgi:D-glycero-D-manno-heptose 1,7-bisphosphate phosphatase
MKKIIILDRDGTVNEDSPDYIKSPDEWHPIPGALEAIAKLNKAGYKVFLTTNQSGIGRGFFDKEMLEKIHEKMIRLLKDVGGHLDGIYVCPHHPDDHCQCRKPNIGMILAIAKEHHFDVKDTLHIGDALRDMEAAKNVGAEAILVLTGKGEKTLKDNPELKDQATICNDLASAVQCVLKKKGCQATEKST